VRGNGYLVLESDGVTQSLSLGLDLEAARSTLRKLDGEVHKRLIEVLKPPRVVYLTTGHLERDYSPPQDDERLSLRDFREALETLGFKVRRLGLGEGLAADVPEDANLVVIAGPTEPFSEPERSALQRFIQRGGSTLLLADPDYGSLLAELTEPFGLRVGKGLLATDNNALLWRFKDAGESPYNLVTTRAATHPSATTLNAAGGRLGVFLKGAGTLSKVEKPPPEAKITFTLRSMGDNWSDDNGDGRFDKELEKRTSWNIGAAVELPAPNAAAVEGSSDAAMARALLLADTDLIGRDLVRNQGNLYLMVDGLRWLMRDAELGGRIESEKDIRIVHRKDADVAWFYGSSVLIPGIFLMGGLFFTRWSRRRRSA